MRKEDSSTLVIAQCPEDEGAAAPRTACYCTEALLTGRVPDLQLDPFVVQQDLLDFEVDPATAWKHSYIACRRG